MSTHFHRLIYTNCLPGQGISESGGFGIQAVSPELPAELSKSATGNLLYVPPSKWTNSAMAAEDYPLSLAHFADQGWGTSQGRYIGEEAVGGRSGNHLTDCILTEVSEFVRSLPPGPAVGFVFLAAGSLANEFVPTDRRISRAQ